MALGSSAMISDPSSWRLCNEGQALPMRQDLRSWCDIIDHLHIQDNLITLTLNKEQEELLLKKLSKATFRLTEKEITLLKRDNKGFKNPSDWTLSLVKSARESEKKLQNEWKLNDSITDQIKQQLGGNDG